MKPQDHIAAHANGLKSSIHALEVQITILKQLIGGKAAAPAESEEDPETDDAPAAETDSDEDDFAAKPAKGKGAKKATSFEEEEDDAPAAAETDDDFTAPPKGKGAKPAKAAKAKKYTLDDVNDACKAKAKSIGGKAGRDKVLAILDKNFDTETVSELKPEQFAKCIELMAV